MLIHADTGILLRLLDRADPFHASIRQAIRRLHSRGDEPVTSPQNAAEFWNVCTRPVSARGGFGLSVQETDRRLRILERIFRLVPDAPSAYAVWRQLVVRHGVQGVQVHDARLAAWMQVHGITHLLTLNPADFSRYPSITAWTPMDLLAH